MKALLVRCIELAVQLKEDETGSDSVECALIIALYFASSAAPSICDNA
jgi:Flp pilus assembly pilin Flp